MVIAKRERERSFSGICSERYGIPPWCSSSRNYVGKRKVVPRRDMAYSIHNIRTAERRNINKGKSLNKHPLIKRMKCPNILSVFSLLTIGLALHWNSDKIPRDLIRNIFGDTKFISLAHVGYSPLVHEECCRGVRHLSLRLSTAETALRKALRVRKTGLYSEYELAPLEERKFVHIDEASAVKGTDTVEWGAQMALWGLIPLWRAAPPPDTVLSLRPPTPSDCWPFSGSRGEVLIDLPPQTRVDRASVEHVWPDTARSAPRNFTIYGSLTNGTVLKILDGTYHSRLPARQYYLLHYKNIFWKQIMFKVLSNQGNTKYTCIYRFHLYKYEHSD